MSNNTEEEFDALKEMATEAILKCQDADLLDLVIKLLASL